MLLVSVLMQSTYFLKSLYGGYHIHLLILSMYIEDLNFSGRQEFQEDSDCLLKIFLFFFLDGALRVSCKIAP